jgi:hypothetical protein
MVKPKTCFFHGLIQSGSELHPNVKYYEHTTEMLGSIKDKPFIERQKRYLEKKTFVTLD